MLSCVIDIDSELIYRCDDDVVSDSVDSCVDKVDSVSNCREVDGISSVVFGNGEDDGKESAVECVDNFAVLITDGSVDADVSGSFDNVLPFAINGYDGGDVVSDVSWCVADVVSSVKNCCATDVVVPAREGVCVSVGASRLVCTWVDFFTSFKVGWVVDIVSVFSTKDKLWVNDTDLDCIGDCVDDGPTDLI